MLSRIAADSVLLLHFSFILFVLLGALLQLRWPRTIWIHLAAVAWGIYIEASGGICPLTWLENDFRRQAGQTGYADSFVEHYLLPLIYPAGLTRELQWRFAALVLLLNLALYGWLFWRRRGRSR